MGADVHSLDNEQVRELYREAGFSGRVGWGSRPAVLVIDLAQAWTDPAEQLGSDTTSCLDATLRTLEAARAGGVPVIFTTMAYDPGQVEIGPVVASKTPHSKLMIRGTDRVRLRPELRRRDDEPLVEKPRASAFFGTNVRSMLAGLDVDTVVVVGVSTSGCIRSTCESAFNHNIRAIVPREAVGDRSPTAHAAALMDIDARFGDVTDLADVLAHLGDG